MFSVEERGRDLFDAAERLDLEGIVAKRRADRYAPGVTWFKRSRIERTRKARAGGSCSRRGDTLLGQRVFTQWVRLGVTKVLVENDPEGRGHD